MTSAGPTPRLLQVVAQRPLSGPLAGHALATARRLGGAVLMLGAPPTAPDAGWEGIELLRQQPSESAAAAWRRALDQIRPEVVFIQHLGDATPALLSMLRERGIASAIFLHDFTPICPTDRLWHARQEPCSGPGRWGWKCALCASAQANPSGLPGALRRLAELPVRTLAYRHRPRLWRTALLRADALVASSRFEREFWIGQGAPPERIAVVPPLSVASAGPLGVEPSGAARPGARRLLYIGGWDDANGASLLAGALDLLRQPVTVIAAGQSGAAAQAALRTAIGRRHRVEFSGDAGSLQPLLAACDAAVVPARWSASFSLLIREAQLAGIPVVASAVGGLSEQIIHGVNGYLAAASDFESLAESLEDALSPPSVYFDPAAASRNARRLEHASAASLERLLALLSSPASQAEAALTLEHGDWLEAAAPAYGVSPSDAARQLVAALRLIHDPGLGDADPHSALALACVQRAASTLRQHTLDLNHAIAFFRACGCRRICALAPGLDTDTLTLFADWNLDAVPATELPDGLWAPLDANSTPALLRRRHPQALALVRQTPAGLETLDWRD